MILTGERPKYWAKNLSRCHFVQHKFHLESPLSNEGLLGERPANNQGKACLVGYDAVYLGDKSSGIMS